ncbi:MAG: hypothetical protein KDC82_02585, partial [Bacteroidetes bacterium]|nr:hypothetical protein [Bacteroidota bacterium]
MRKYLFAIGTLSILAASFFVLRNTATETVSNYNEENTVDGISKSQRFLEALQWRNEKLLNEETGEFNVADYFAAVKRADELKNSAAKKGALNMTWSLIGPDNQGGRTRALIFDSQVPNKMWAGGVGGGLFQSLDAGNSWTRVETYNGYFPIASIAQSSTGELYVGTGEGLGNTIIGSRFSSQSPGNGIYKSTDGGFSWYHLLGTDANNSNQVVSGTCDWCGVNDIAISPTNPNLILAATEGGLRISTIAGEDVGAWTSASGISQSLQGQSVEITSDGQTAFATFGGRVFRSTDAANNFTTGWVQAPVTGGQRADIAIAPSNEDYVYATVTGSNQCLLAVWRSTDKGLTWNIIVNGGTPYVNDPFNQPTSGIGECAGQGWYDQTVAVNPADENKIYIGGISLYTWGDGYGMKRADKIDTEGGGPFDSDYIHADKHEIIFNPLDPTGNTMLIGSDGGVTLCNNANSGFPDNLNFIQKNRGYATLQIYGMGAGAAGEVLSGNQDNGSQYIDGLGSSVQAAKEISGGDGVYAEISNLDPDVMFAGVYFGQINRSVNRGLSTNDFVDDNISKGCGSIRCTTVTANSPCDPSGGDAPFIYPFYLMETSTVTNQQATASLSARNDTLLLASGATQIVYDTLFPAYSVRTTITIKDGVSTTEKEVTNTPTDGYEYTSAVSESVTFFSNLASTLFPGETDFINDPFDAKYFVTSNCGLWMCV